MDGFLAVTLATWLAGQLALRREGRTPRSLAAPFLAPFGRLHTVPAGTEVYSAKRWHFRLGVTCEPMRVWVGWWNCRAFHEGEERFYFVERRSRFAVPASAIP
jgi:hypothetical protein